MNVRVQDFSVCRVGRKGVCDLGDYFGNAYRLVVLGDLNGGQDERWRDLGVSV